MQCDGVIDYGYVWCSSRVSTMTKNGDIKNSFWIGDQYPTELLSFQKKQVNDQTTV
jgi:hypothetical protein